jgi:galactokinase
MEPELEKLLTDFRDRFSAEPRLFLAPGRVNLIGEHTDYNDGFVMPFAIDRHVLVAGKLRDDSIINVRAMDLDEEASLDLRAQPVKRRGSWLDYVEGGIRCVEQSAGAKLRGADLMISSTVPIGAGLSSSAAIETAVGHAILSLNEIQLDRKALAFASQQAEHEFVGIRSGIMDQFASVFGRHGHAMLLDCRSLEIEYIPLPKEDDVAIAVIDTKVKHNLASSEYNTRRAECEKGVEIMREYLPDITSLRDVSRHEFERLMGHLPEPIRSRCRHVISENERTVTAAEAFRSSDFVKAGELMSNSHRSLRDDYKVSSAELDFLVETAREVVDVFGARMTGGGFGGCTVNLVGAGSVEELRSVTTAKYSKRFGFAPDFYIFQASSGASELTV